MDGGHEQLISNGERFKPAFSERDKNQTMIDLRGSQQTGLKTSYVPPQGFLGYGHGRLALGAREKHKDLT
jgi:hypothetical protein